jgi:hypothetical protein
MSTSPQFYIKEGVRRAVAAREAGRKDIPARIIEAGKIDVYTRLSLTQLHSPKPGIARDHRYIRYAEYPIQVLQLDPAPIDVEPLGLPTQSAAIPLAQVILR